jgi:hypothetical protein
VTLFSLPINSSISVELSSSKKKCPKRKKEKLQELILMNGIVGNLANNIINRNFN